MDPEIQRHLDLARQAAGDDLQSYLRLGDTALPRPAAPQPDLASRINRPAPPPAQAFDNLYFVGSEWVSAWVVATAEGLVLIDALNNDEEAARVVEAGMRRLSLDPSQIKMVIVTHGHGDHYGGIGHIKTIASPTVAASGNDWTMMETKLEFDNPLWGRPPHRDLTVADGERLDFGDTTIEILETPGHTTGTLSVLLTVRERGREHRALLWGGTSFNFGKQPDRLSRLQSYIDATERIQGLARQRDVDVFFSNHSSFDKAITKLAAIPAAAENPFVMGTDATVRALTVMNECAQATMVAWRA